MGVLLATPTIGPPMIWPDPVGLLPGVPLPDPDEFVPEPSVDPAPEGAEDPACDESDPAG